MEFPTNNLLYYKHFVDRVFRGTNLKQKLLSRSESDRRLIVYRIKTPKEGYRFNQTYPL